MPASARTACTVKMKRKSFRAHLPGLPLTKTFSPLFPVSHPEQDSQGHICHDLRWLQQLTDHLCQSPQETSPARPLRTRGRLERSSCTAPSAAAVERESVTTARQRSGRDLLPFCSSGIVLAMPCTLQRRVPYLPGTVPLTRGQSASAQSYRLTSTTSKRGFSFCAVGALEPDETPMVRFHQEHWTSCQHSLCTPSRVVTRSWSQVSPRAGALVWPPKLFYNNKIRSVNKKWKSPSHSPHIF